MRASTHESSLLYIGRNDRPFITRASRWQPADSPMRLWPDNSGARVLTSGLRSKRGWSRLRRFYTSSQARTSNRRHAGWRNRANRGPVVRSAADNRLLFPRFEVGAARVDRAQAAPVPGDAGRLGRCLHRPLRRTDGCRPCAPDAGGDQIRWSFNYCRDRSPVRAQLQPGHGEHTRALLVVHSFHRSTPSRPCGSVR